MKIITITILLLFLYQIPMKGQNKYDYIWDMGYSYSRGPLPDHIPLFGFRLNFNNGETKIDTFLRSYDFRSRQVFPQNPTKLPTTTKNVRCS
jgi:hypothetical protein